MTDLISNFVAQNSAPMLTNIGAGIAGVVQQKRAEKAAAEREAAYQTALMEYSKDKTSEEKRLALIEAGRANGTFDLAEKSIASMDKLSQKNQLTGIVKSYSAVLSGFPELAIKELEEEALANENDGDDSNNGDAKELRFFADQLKQGKTEEFLMHHGALASLFEGGNEAIQNALDITADRRADTELGLKIMDAGAKLDLAQGGIDAMKEFAKNDERFGKNNLRALNYAVAVEGGMPADAEEYNNLIRNMRLDFQKGSKTYFDAEVLSDKLAGTIQDAQNATDATAKGLADISSVNAFQKMIDDATVREGDVALIRSATGFAEQLGLWVNSFKDGDVLSADQRRQMASISKDLVNAEKRYVDEVVYPALHATHSRIDPKGSTYDEVFSGYTPAEGPRAYGSPGNTPSQTATVGSSYTPPAPAPVPEEVKKASGAAANTAPTVNLW